ncbi:MAG: YraN family protein [Vicingaceae bacterium]
MAEHNETGEAGEAMAKEHLLNAGYKILEQNWRYKKAEIDIIAQLKNTLVIVEVKTRTSRDFERPQDAVTISKQRHLVRAADAYIQEFDIDLECRFDVISVLIEGPNIDLEHIEEAFVPLL